MRTNRSSGYKKEVSLGCWCNDGQFGQCRAEATNSFVAWRRAQDLRLQAVWQQSTCPGRYNLRNKHARWQALQAKKRLQLRSLRRRKTSRKFYWAPQRACRLLCLPSEVRSRIWDTLLQDAYLDVLPSFHAEAKRNLMATCQFIEREVGERALRLRLKGIPFRNVDATAEFSRNLYRSWQRPIFQTFTMILLNIDLGAAVDLDKFSALQQQQQQRQQQQSRPGGLEDLLADISTLSFPITAIEFIPKIIYPDVIDENFPFSVISMDSWNSRALTAAVGSNWPKLFQNCESDFQKRYSTLPDYHNRLLFPWMFLGTPARHRYALPVVTLNVDNVLALQPDQPDESYHFFNFFPLHTRRGITIRFDFYTTKWSYKLGHITLTRNLDAILARLVKERKQL